MFELLLNYRIFRILLNISTLILIFFLCALLALFIFQSKLLYIPSFGREIPRYMVDNPLGYRNPSEKGMSYRDVLITTSDKETLHGWFVFREEKQHTLEQEENSFQGRFHFAWEIIIFSLFFWVELNSYVYS